MRLLYRSPPPKEGSRGDRIPVQFGREVIARLLKVPERAHWKACVKSKEMETTIAESFKDKFKPFDQTAA